jgi:hypothetical protein
LLVSQPATEQEAYEAILLQIRAWLQHAINLRTVEVPAANAGPQAFHEARVTTRSSLDQMEELLSQLIELEGGLRRRARELANRAEDEWDLVSQSRHRNGQVAEYSSARERAAECNLETRQYRLAARAAEELADVAKTALERLWLKYRGLQATRQDLANELRYHAFENYLERS